MKSLDHDVIRAFWKDRSQQQDNRWTSDELLDWEAEQLSPYAEQATSILDLGSGHGRLSRRLAGESIPLTAVDFMPGFAEAFTQPNHRFVHAAVDEFDSAQAFDLTLLFGVVSYLEEPVELKLYEGLARWCSDGGHTIVKNQCGRAEELVITGWSEQLASEYSVRYPTAATQQTHLRQVFGRVDLIPYPEPFNPWPESEHVMFCCSEPRR